MMMGFMGAILAQRPWHPYRRLGGYTAPKRSSPVENPENPENAARPGPYRRRVVRASARSVRTAS
ncbi:protein of unknown function [Streptomyces sp. KY75]|nr:protein of unknown function [Streptomyces sp. KY70]CAD5987863.1 protein of unknown function [Streptomyces sp. KY75]